MAIRHSITLSTSEPNNEVGNLKIRQGDEQTQTLVANITENGVPKPFVGLQPFFCAKLGQTAGLGIIEQKVTGPMNPANGTLEYVMQPEDWQQLGRQTAYFSFRKMVNDHEWTEQFSTRDFNYNVTKSVFSEGVKETKKDGSTYIWTIEDMLRSFKEYIATGKVEWENYKNDERTIWETYRLAEKINWDDYKLREKNEWQNYKVDEKTTWEKFVEDNREFLENADPGGKIILELLGGRGGFDSLGERLDSDKAEVTAQLAQTKNQVYSKDTKKIKPMVTFYLDDGHANDYDVVLPKASSLNIPLTISLHNGGGLINRPDDLKELVNTHGWEVHAHTVGNTDLRTLTLEEQKQTMRENKEFLENTFGFDVRGVCYPMGYSNSDTYVAAREYFDVGLESYYTRVPENLPPIKTYGLQRVALIADIETLKQTIDNIKEKGEGWIVFYSHSALYNQAGSEKETLFALMDYAVASGVDVVTVGEAMEVYQNKLDIGDKVYSDKVAKIGSNGNVDFTDIPFVVDNDGYETINEKKGIDFLSNKITISYFNGTNQSNIPFDNGRGTLYTDRLNEASIYVGADAVQTFSSHLGNSYVRKYGGGVWGEWTSTSGFNTARITGNLEDKPITEYPENKVTAVSYVGADNTGISVGSGIGTVITMRLLGAFGTLSRQFFYPIHDSSYYTRRWLGSNQWDRWERVSTNIIKQVARDYGTLDANESKTFSFDIDGVSGDDSVNVNFNYGLINGVIYYPFIEGNNVVKIKLINVTSSSKLVGSRGTVINVTKTGM